ncbi:MAG: NAD(P)H-dependent oxidoreductase [Desulfobacterales bacterium]|jgi:NAD(P)H-dependent FMN reductase|nr:NAD(P)H-dependent oxidoreductase [Desulfobacterales bacterium]MDD3951143.1 NAD(P)H-dependent oxidoreductase [Desulfobacterales bacterium]
MRIVVLCGSARKGGNTDLLVRAFVDGALEHNEVEIISVGEVNVKPCIGCNACRKRETHNCFQQDDMPEIYEKLKTAEMIVIASPVYFYGLSAQLKAIIDRLHSPIRNEFKVKELALLLVAADTIPEVFDSILVQYRAILKYFHLKDAGNILVRGVEGKGAIRGNPALKEARELGAMIRERE